MGLLSHPLESAQFFIRSRLPLGFNDRANISTRYSRAMLRALQSTSAFHRKDKILNRFAEFFQMDVSALRLAHTLYADPLRIDYFAHIDKGDHTLSGPALGLLTRARKRLTLFSEDPKETSGTHSHMSSRLIDLRPQFSPVKDQACAPLEMIEKKKAMIILGNPQDPLPDFSVFKPYTSLSVLTYSNVHSDTEIRRLKQLLPHTVTLDTHVPKIEQYSQDYKRWSQFCDDTGAIALKTLKEKDSLDLVPEGLEETLSLHLSDAVFGALQRYYAAFKLAAEADANCAIYVCETNTRLSNALAREFSCPVYSLTYGGEPLHDMHEASETLLQDSPASLTPIIAKVDRRIKRVVGTLPKSKKSVTLVAGSSWSPTYRRAISAIADYVGLKRNVHTLDAAPVTGSRAILKALLKPTLLHALNALTSAEQRRLARYFGMCQLENLPNVSPLKYLQEQDILQTVRMSIIREIDTLLGLVSLYNSVRDYLSSRPRSLLIVLPSSLSMNRILVHAFQDSAHPTLDVQALFVSNLLRYRSPLADYCAVIDLPAKSIYRRRWDIAEENIHIIGSLLLDQDIAQARDTDPEHVREKYLKGTTDTVITFAAQPIADEHILKSVKDLCDWLENQPRAHLCIKLHRGQTDALKAQIEAYLGTRLGAGRYSVLKFEPFAEILSATEILLTYFSNVGLMAPAFDIPLLALPHGVPKSGWSLVDIGVAIEVKDEAGLAAKLDELMESLKFPRSHAYSAVSSYARNNPATLDGQTLQRLEALIDVIYAESKT